jgi:hypothetical protein
MKKVTLLMAFILLALMLTGCTLTKDFEFDIEREFDVRHPHRTYSTVEDVDATEYSSDFEKYKEDLEDLELEAAYYTVTYNGNTSAQTVTHAVLSVDEIGGTIPVELSHVDNINLDSVLNTEIKLTVNSGGEDELIKLLEKSPYSARFTFDGTVTEEPVDFKVKFRLRFKVTYKKKII